MSDKKLVSDSTVNYLVNKIKNDYIPFEDIIDLQQKVVNPPTETVTSVVVTPDTNYEGFSTVTVNELNPEQVTVQSTAEQQVINNKYISKVTVEPIVYEDKTVTLSQDSTEILPDTDEAMNSVTITPRIIVSQEKTAQTKAITKTITPDENYNIMSKLTVNPYNRLQDVLAGNLFDITDDDLPGNYTTIPAYIAPNIEHIDVNRALTLKTIICEKGIHPSAGYIDPSNEIVEEIKYENLKSLNTNGGNIIIESCALKDNQYLTTIPATNNTYIACGSHAFENSAITSVPPIATGLSSYAFYNCKDLDELHFYGTLENIGDYAFAGCTKLTSVYFPNAGYNSSRLPGRVGKHAFEGCTGLTSISFNYSAPGMGTNGVNISDLGDYAFKNCTSLTNVRLINAFSTGTGVFEGCTSLTSVTLPENGYVTFGANMFKGCTSLSSIISPISPIRWDFAGSTVETSNNVFDGTAIAELELAPLIVVNYSYINNKYVTNPGILLGMDNLKKLTVHDIWSYDGVTIYMPYNVEHIVIDGRTKQDTSYDKYVGLKNFKSSDHSLNINTSLKKVEYINSTRALDDFSDCVNLTDVSLCEGLTWTPSFYGCTNLTSIELPSTVTGLASFEKTGLTSISSENVTAITSFKNCTALTSVDLPNVITIGNYAFQNCTGLTSIDLPNVTVLGSNVFENCTNLTSVDLSNSQITNLDGFTFNNCAALTSVNLPSTLISFNSWQTFAYCISLVNITLPDNLTTGGTMAFVGCTSLQTVSLGPNITNLDVAFSGCTALTTITVRGNSSCATAQTLQALGPSAYNNATIVYTEN